MIEFIEVMFRALTGLRLSFPTAISLSVFFAAGYYFASTTKRLNPFKAIFVLFLAYLLSTVLSGMLGVFTLAAALGFLSNQGLFLARVFLWVESLSELWIILRHRTAFEEIREEETARPRAKPKPQRASQEKPKSRPGPKSNNQQKSEQNTDWKPRSGSAPDLTRALRILELAQDPMPGSKEINKAFRRLALIHHPDLPSGNAAKFRDLVSAREFLLAQV